MVQRITSFGTAAARYLRPFLALGLVLGGNAAGAATLLPDFSSATFAPGAAINNLYFPLGPSYQATLAAEGLDEDGEPFSETTQLSFGGTGPTLLGVQTTVQYDLASEDGVIVEETFDYYAQDTDGNVWYFGEDVINYVYDEDGNLIETNNESAWLAGIGGALPGYIMPATPEVGQDYFQEFSEVAGALDEALVFATGLTVGSGGVTYKDVIAILETTELDPDAKEFKYYAPGVGLILIEEGLDDSFGNPELVFEIVPTAPVPLPAGLPFLIAGIGALATVRSVRRPARQTSSRRTGS